MSNLINQLASSQQSIQSLSTDPSQKMPILSFLENKKPNKTRNFITPQIDFQISIIDTKVVQEGFALYEIKVQKGNVYWIFQTRYSLLESLNSKISKTLKSKLPKFPEKRIFGNLDKEFLMHRTEKLNVYLKEMFKLGRSENVVKEFLRQTQHSATEIYDPSSVANFRLDM